MAMIWVYLVLAISSSCWADQETIDYLASNIYIEYNVIDNIGSAATFDGHLALTNTGPEDVTDLNWSLYFCSSTIIEPGSRDPDGTDFGDAGLRIYMINGGLQRIDPNATFPGFLTGQTIDVYFTSSGSQIMVVQTMPNWYFTSMNDEPRVCANTAGEDFSWVGDFNTPEQWKRSNQDTYNPYTGPDRMALQNYSDLGVAPSMIMPTVVDNNLDISHMVDIGTGDWLVVYGDPSLVSEAEYLADALGTVAVDPTFTPSSHYILLLLEDSFSPEDEAYLLRVNHTNDYITISGTDSAGAFYGAQSLLSLYTYNTEIPGGFVVDYPRFHYRGMHVDVSRNFHDKADIIRLIDVMAMYKMNKLHLHLSDDEGWRIEIPGLPELTEIGSRRCHDLSGDFCILPQRGSAPGLSNDGTGYYSVSDYRQILAYADVRHVQVIPEIDVPAHSDAAIKAMLARYRKYADTNMTAATQYLLSDLEDESSYISVQGFANNSINPCIESTYTFVDHVVKELVSMHQGIQELTTFHFGGDEVPSGSWRRSPACDAISNNTDYLMEMFVRNVADMAHSLGLELSGWEHGFMTDGVPYNTSAFPNSNIYAYAWNNIFETGQGDKAYTLANADYKTVLCPATHLYLSHPEEPDPYDRGAYWATRIISNYKVFGFMPDDMYENMGVNANGNPIDKDAVCERFGCPPLEPGKEGNIIGIQAHLWSETVRNSEHLDYMIYPRVLAVAERAWHKASWEDTEDTTTREEQRMVDFGQFANTLGYKELARLEARGVQFNINPPGAQISEDSRLEALAEFPGLPIVYSTDGGNTWIDYDNQVLEPGVVQVVTRSPNGSKSSRVTQLVVP